MKENYLDIADTRIAILGAFILGHVGLPFGRLFVPLARNRFQAFTFPPHGLRGLHEKGCLFHGSVPFFVRVCDTPRGGASSLH